MPTWHETETGLFEPVDSVAAGSPLQEAAAQVAAFIDEAEELAWQALDHYGETTGPREQRIEVRKRLIAQSRVALLRDPVAGAEAMHLANFSFGSGVPKPQAKDPDVQEIFDKAWDDPVNQEAMTGFEAQRKLSNDLLTSANVFLIGFEANGMFRVGTLAPERVREIVTDPEDVNRALYYLTTKIKRVWDFEKDQWTPQQGEPEKIYYPHWRNVEAYEEEAGERGEKIIKPPKEKLADGQCYHVRVNRVGETQFGTPPWARTLRFYSGLNRLTEARIAMAQAAAAFIAKRVTKGGPAQVQKAATSVLRQAGDLAATLRAGESTPTGAPMQPPPRSGSIFNENEAHTLQPLSLNSGGPGAQADAQIVRAPLAANSGFGQHYLGDASNANLATATSLELPALMQVGSWQESFEQAFRWWCDKVLEAAVRSGRLGGSTAGAEGGKALSELHLWEAEDKAEAEERTGKDLTYSFQMPYPGRRNLPDVMSTVKDTIGTFDAGLQNKVLLKEVLVFLFGQGFQVEDPSGLADAILDFELPAPPAEPPPEAPMPGEEPGVAPGSTPNIPADEQSVNGEKRRGSPPKRAMAMTESVDDSQVVAFIEEIDALWRQHVDVERLADLAVGNGNGNSAA